jgi:hypothetical protein
MNIESPFLTIKKMFDIEKLKVDSFLGCISLKIGAFVIGSYEIFLIIIYMLINLIFMIDRSDRGDRVGK